MIDSTDLKVFGEGEWKTRQHGKEKRRVWRKIHLAIDVDSHESVSGKISIDGVHDPKVLPDLLRDSSKSSVLPSSFKRYPETTSLYYFF